MVTLPVEPGRREIRAFWTVASLAPAIVAAWLVPAGPVPSGLVGLAAAAAVALVGWLAPRRVEGVYGAWNRVAELTGRAAARWVSLVTFYALVSVVSRGGSRMRWEKPGSEASGWTTRSDRESSHAAQHHGARRPSADAGWIRSVTRWARDTGNLWALGLIPLLALLRLLRPRAARSLGENIYTLY